MERFVERSSIGDGYGFLGFGHCLLYIRARGSFPESPYIPFSLSILNTLASPLPSHLILMDVYTWVYMIKVETVLTHGPNKPCDICFSPNSQ